MIKKTAQSNKLLAFVTDAESQKILQSVPTDHLQLISDIRIGGINESIDFLKNNASPAVLVVDLSSSKLPVSDIKKIADCCEPGVKVIAIGDKNEVGIFRQLLSLGVQDYVVKPLSDKLLLKTFESVVLGNDDRNTKAFSEYGKLISFVGARGGIGVSTLLANCGFLLANQYTKKTSLIDLNVQGSMLSHLLDTETSTGFRDVLEAPQRIDDLFTERVMVRQTDNLSVLSSEEALDEPFLISEGAVSALLPIILSQFQYSLFDLPRSFSDGINTELLLLSNTVVIVCDTTLVSVRDVVRLTKLIRENENPEQKIILVVNNEGLYKEGHIDHDLFEESVQKKIDCVISFDSITPLVALNDGKPVVGYNGPLAKGIHQLAALLIDQTAIFPDTSGKMSFINRFFARNR
tara:strand:+ start:416 stop:1633 length:1218 start_codon:yes stop_codon:yes gene_type:complete